MPTEFCLRFSMTQLPRVESLAIPIGARNLLFIFMPIAIHPVLCAARLFGVEKI
jgi:hypothetical protein